MEIEAEDFYSYGLGGYYEALEGFNMLFANRGVYTADKLEFAVWVNYTTRELMIYLQEGAEGQEKAKRIFERYYKNKGYKINYTHDFKWSA